MSETEFDPQAPPANQRVTELYVCVAIHAGGGEGIMSADVTLPSGVVGHAPMMTSQLRLVARMLDLAKRAAEKHTPDPVTIQVRRFVLSDDR